MPERYDVISVGGGHNGLVAAAYLAKAGKSVLVLERNSYLGGGVVTQELTAPGFLCDLHSSAHIMVQANPMIANDELGLLSEFGLKYAFPDAPFGTSFDDGSALITYRDIEKTALSIAQFSKADADAYRRFAEMAVRAVPMFTSGLFTPPLPAGALFAMMDQSVEGQEFLGMMMKSGWDIVNQWFTNDKLKIHFLKFVSENLQGPEEKGTGLGLLMMIGLTHTTGIGLPIGGSGKLTEALAACIEKHGGRIRTGRNVTRFLRKGERISGVATEDGQEYLAEDAVIGAIHPHLLRTFFPETDEGVLRRAEAVELSPFSAMNTHYALHERAHYRGEDALLQEAYMTELVPTDIERFRRLFDELRYQRVPDPFRTFSAGCQSNHDPCRAPEGKAGFYFMSFSPYRPDGQDASRWDAIKDSVGDRMLRDVTPWIDNLAPDNIIARCLHSPLDLSRSSASFQQGDFHGAGPYLHQMNGHRPTPDLAQYKVPGVEGFYLVGPFMHPGGGVFGAGRGAAIKLCDDIGVDFDAIASR